MACRVHGYNAECDCSLELIQEQSLISKLNRIENNLEGIQEALKKHMESHIELDKFIKGAK